MKDEGYPQGTGALHLETYASGLARVAESPKKVYHDNWGVE